jgi:5-methylcytosine-specific restriction endonuclease McrA
MGRAKYKGKYYSPKRRAIYARGDAIDPVVLFERDGWICCICTGQIDRRLRTPHPMAATIEHKVPLCQGGEHVWANVGASHYQCNMAKADRVDITPGQSVS